MGYHKVVNVVTAWAVEGECTDAGIALWPGDLTYTFVDRVCFAPLGGTPLFDDAQFAGAFSAGTMVLDPATDEIFADWPSGDLHLSAETVLIDWGTNFVDVDPATPGYQFLPEFDLDRNPRIVDGDGDGVANVDIGPYEHQPH